MARTSGVRVQTVRHVVLLALFSMSSPAVQAQDAPPDTPKDGWVLRVQRAERYTAQAPHVEGFWIGLTNAATDARVACIAEVDWDVIDTDHGKGGMVEGRQQYPGLPGDPSAANLVLPGETLFVWGGVPVPEWAAHDADVRFVVSVVDYSTRRWAMLLARAPLRDPE